MEVPNTVKCESLDALNTVKCESSKLLDTARYKSSEGVTSTLVFKASKVSDYVVTPTYSTPVDAGLDIHSNGGE